MDVSDSEITTTQSFVVSVADIPEDTNYWPALLMELIGGLVGAVVMSWLMNRWKRIEAEKHIEETEEVPEADF